MAANHLIRYLYSMAKYTFPDLSEDIRTLMLNEVQHDISKRTFFYNPRFNANGRKVYMPALKEAIANGSEETLQAALEDGENFNKYEAHGKKVSGSAAMTFAQAEFNRYYCRAICVKTLEQQEKKVEVFRANGVVTAKKTKADQRIGSRLDAEKLLQDLRTSVGITPTFFPEIVSGLSVQMPHVEVEAVENMTETISENQD